MRIDKAPAPMSEPTMVERCAWAFLTNGKPFDAVEWAKAEPHVRHVGMHAAQLVLAAMREPTEEIIDAGIVHVGSVDMDNEPASALAAAMWRVQITAALGKGA